MDVFAKRHLWLIDAAAVALCAALAGRAVAHLLAQSWLPAVERTAAASARDPAGSSTETTRTKETATIIARDVFCSDCRTDRKRTDDGGVIAIEGTRTSLPLELVSTMYVAGDDRWSIAVIRDLGSNGENGIVCNKGKTLPGGVRVLSVGRGRVWIDNKGREEYLDIDRAPLKPGGAAAAPASVGSTGDGEVARSVRCHGSRCEIDRRLIDRLLADPGSIAGDVRVVPSSGGFKLEAIRRSSVLARLGLESGDVLKSINGMELSNPQQAIDAYLALRSASHLSLSIERRGRRVTSDFIIR
jgi:general secretion pathway protein C